MKSDQSNFRSQLIWLKKSWDFISPDKFSRVMSGELVLERDSLLITFDDGFKCCRDIADEVLEPLDIRALFFVISEFCCLKTVEDYREFVCKNIKPDSCISCDQIGDECANLTFDDLRYLQCKGHSIGAHTATHANLSKLGDNELTAEIVKSADYLATELKVKVEHFAYTFGNVDSFSAKALTLARSRFRYVYTGLRGGNESRNLWAVRRDAVSPQDAKYAVGAILEGALDLKYRTKIKIFESWGNI